MLFGIKNYFYLEITKIQMSTIDIANRIKNPFYLRTTLQMSGSGDFFKKELPVTVDSFDKSLVEKVKIIDELEAEQKNHIYAIIDMAVSNKRLKHTLTTALNSAL